VYLLMLVSFLTGFGFIVLGQLRQRIKMEAELRQAHRSVQEMALTDSLTGLGNRRKLDMVLTLEIRRAKRQGYPLALIMLDVDYFKRFNDQYGHSAGDDCLRLVADTIRTTLKRPADLAVRYGGEEFTVLLPDTTDVGASLIAQEIVDAIRTLTLEHREHPLGIVTISGGIASCTPATDEVSADALIKAADGFLYTAKNNGRNRWEAANRNSMVGVSPHGTQPQ